jgi:DNA polymerase III subunit epsilon
MRTGWRTWAAALLPGALLAGWTAAAVALVLVSLDPAARQAMWQLVEGRIALVVLVWVAASAALGAWMRQIWQHHVTATARVAEQAQVLVDGGVQRSLNVPGGAEAQAVQAVVNQLVLQRTALQADVDQRVRTAARAIEQERRRLAALMAELTQSVVVCNLDGRILLYNNRARLQFRALSDAVAGGAELLGIGRSIYAVFDRQLVAHALESVQLRLQRGAAHPSAQFVTGTRGGQLLRVQLAPVRGLSPDDRRDSAGGVDDVDGVDGESLEAGALDGFVLMLDNITRDLADDHERDRQLQQWTQAGRVSLGRLQAAARVLSGPDDDETARAASRAVLHDELEAMSRRTQDLERHALDAMKSRWPLEDMLGVDLLRATARSIERQGTCRVALTDVDDQLWLKVDSFTLMQALAHLAGRLVEDRGVSHVELRLQPADQGPQAQVPQAQLDLVWIGQAMNTETATDWETDPIRMAGEASALSVRDVVQRHGGRFGFERERARQASYFRFLLPRAAEGEPLEPGALLHGDSRPEFYDFDLFAVREGDALLAERRLVDLSYTVFDTETTGLQPSQGDEIIQIGATRIVAGKLRRQECFEQLVDPQRAIPAAGIAIHGITPEQVQGQPPLARVLPAFHAFAQDTVLVAHNAAFDMRFLQLKEASTGVRFDQPVLDTLLLSAVIHPQQASHRLEAIAERLDVTILGRHTALGDAMVTAEVFLKMIPLLAEQGIHTLAQARDAAQRTAMARVRY